MYLGQIKLKIGDDGRLAIPSSFRGLFSQGAYVTRGFEQNLLIMSAEVFQEKYGRLSTLNMADPAARLLQRLLLANATILEMDASGNVYIPKELMGLAGLDSNIVLVGQGNLLEAWSPAAWERQAVILSDAAANTERFAKLDIVL